MQTTTKQTSLLAVLLIAGLALCGCEKYLDAKSNQKLVIASTVQDLQALLDYYVRVSQFDPSAAEKSADDYYLTTTDYNGLSAEGDRRLYIWEKDYLFARGFNDWSYTYDNVYRANTVLDNIDKIPHTAANEREWKAAKGHALFLRGASFLKLAWIWAPAYDQSTAATDLGIPLRLDPDFNKLSVRASVQHTYAQILRDLEEAVRLLPATPLHVLRPSRPAAYALLARTYLSMRRYTEAGLYADSCLQEKATLLDYNTLNPNATFPVPRFNAEVILDAYMNTPSMLLNTRAKIDSGLYRSYAANDLRKTVFFRNNNNGSFGFKGSYAGAGNLFDGIAVDEVLLIRAEAYARANQTTDAMKDLNTLLAKRWKAGSFVPLAAADAGEALRIILEERRKELLMRGLRWSDIKRLNREGAGIVLTRIVNGKTYTLPPNDPRYALPIPEDVIDLTGMPQNPR